MSSKDSVIQINSDTIRCFTEKPLKTYKYPIDDMLFIINLNFIDTFENYLHELYSNKNYIIKIHEITDMYDIKNSTISPNKFLVKIQGMTIVNSRNKKTFDINPTVDNIKYNFNIIPSIIEINISIEKIKIIDNDI